MNFHFITLFPDSFSSYIANGILGRAVADDKVSLFFYNPRDYTEDKDRRVDHRPYGGGPGMVLEAPSIIKCIDHILSKFPVSGKQILFVWLEPRGKAFTNSHAEHFKAKYTDIVFICGRYEGVDARVRKIIKDIQKSEHVGEFIQLSIGRYTLMGGELASLVIAEATARRIAGVLGKDESVEERRTSSRAVYTRPKSIVYKGKTYSVPRVLLTGHHQNIDNWREKH